MIMNRISVVPAWALLPVAALALGLVSCGSHDTGSSGFNTDPGTGSSGGSSGSSGSSSGQSSSGGSSGSPTSSGSSGSSSSGGASGSSGSDASTGAGSSSGSASDDSGVPMPSHGCGQGTSCTPGNDLAAPAAADGFQFVLQSGQVTIQPNTEAYYCYYKTIPGNATIEVGAFQSWMSENSSHHFITYQVTGGASPDGTLEQCAGVAGKWVYATSVAGQVIELKMPDTVGLSMNAGTQLVLNMHFVNPGTAPVSPTLKLNVLYAKNVMYQAGTMVSFNASIDV